MARFNFIHNSFSAGEVTPKFFGRTESQQYNQSCERLKNFIVYPEGGAGRRPGTRFVREITVNGAAKLPPTQTRVIPFYGTDGTRWLLILDGSGIANNPPQMLNAVTKVSENVIVGQTDLTGTPTLYAAYNFDAKNIPLNEIQFAQSGDVIVLTHRRMKPAVIQYDYTKAAGARFIWRGYTDPYLKPQGYQNGSISFDPLSYKLTPYLPIITTAGFIKAIRATVGGTQQPAGNFYTLSFAGSTQTFDATWVGRYVKLNWSAITLIVYITGVTDSVTATARYVTGIEDSNNDLSTQKQFGGPTGNTGVIGSSWEISAWDDSHGWPSAVAFFEQRLLFGGTNYNPDSIWFSQIGDIYEMTQKKLQQDPDFGATIVATDAFDITLRSNLLNDIRWMLPKKNITVGTNYGEFIVSGPDQNSSIGPTNLATSQETPHGSALVQAIPMSNTTLFLQRDRKTMREMVYNFNEDSYKATNLSILSSHITMNSTIARIGDNFRRTTSAIVALARQEVPVGIVWAIDNNGSLLSMTRERDQEVVAWAYHELSGATFIGPVGSTQPYKPFAQSICALQRTALGTDGTGGEPDEIWVTVQRGQLRAGAWTRVTYLECLAQDWDRATIDGDWVTAAEPKIAPIYMDCTRIYDSSEGPSGVMSTLPFSEGESVGVVMGGSWLGYFTVTGGAVDISAFLKPAQIAGSQIWQALIGYNYDADLVPVTPSVPAATGSSQGQIRRIDQLAIHFYRALGAKFGRLTSSAEANTPIDGPEVIPFPAGANSGGPIPLFTGEKRLNFPQSYETRPQVLVRSYLPFPCVVSHIIARGAVYEGGA